MFSLKFLLTILILVIMLERMARHLIVVRFLKRPLPVQKRPIQLVSILQPILSGDPTLAEGLEKNLLLISPYPLEFLWLLDEDDDEGRRICAHLETKHPGKIIHLITLPPPENHQNPKMIKLIAGQSLAKGDVLCVLDDDTRLEDGGLEACLPFLDEPGVGLAFGLPYYVSFGNFWSSLVAYFVNSQSLLNYIPYAFITHPVTINGMFYCLRREVFNNIGGFVGLENVLADDFAIAQRTRKAGYLLAQTPVRHGISTWVNSSTKYFNLIQRWFIFPRESMMRHLRGSEQASFYLMAILPIIFPWIALAAPFMVPSLWPLSSIYFIYSYTIFAHFNIAYLQQASPWKHSYWAILIPIILPVQILSALIAPQKINWRGHIMQAEQGGGFQFIRRRTDTKK
jgi:ceramide glucosyltransferase